MRRRLLLSTPLALAVAFGAWAWAQSASPSAQLFTQRCSSCHSIGEGDRVGPDLKGVMERHSPQHVGVLSSARLTNEENYLIQKLARTGLKTHSVHSCEAT